MDKSEMRRELIQMADSIDCPHEIELKELHGYVKDIYEKENRRRISRIKIIPDGDYVNIGYELEPVRFERVRRITGYLVGTTERWNNAKQAELADRVKHETGMEQI